MKPGKSKTKLLNKKPAVAKVDSLELYNVCLACSEKGDFKVVCQTYYHNGQPEVYAQMLSYCFSFQISHSAEEFGKVYYICDECISKLRSAAIFRKQIEIAQNNYKKIFNEFAVFYNPEDRKPDLGSELGSDDDNLEEVFNDNRWMDKDETGYVLNLNNRKLIGESIENKVRKVRREVKTAEKLKIKHVSVSQSSCLNDDPGVPDGKIPSLSKYENVREPTDEILPEESKTALTTQNESSLREDFLNVHEGEHEKACGDVNMFVTVQESKNNNSDIHCNDNYFNFEVPIIPRRKFKSHSGLYACNECSYTTLICSNLSRHLKSHLKDKPFLCETCGYACKTTTKLRLHQTSHSEIKPYACDKCKFTCRLHNDLKCHMRIHADIRPHTCENCGVSFRRSQHLKAHKLKHETTSKLCCEMCSFTTYNALLMKRHNFNHTKSYACEICKKIFNELIDWRVHKATEHDIFTCATKTAKNNSEITSDRTHICEICNLSFKTLFHLKSHTVIHSDKRPYSCEVCDSTFKRKGDLTAHNLIHSNTKPYSCKQCSFATVRLGDLREHFRIHTDYRPFKCNSCPLRFRKNNHLKQHIATHSEYKPFVCAVCGYMCKRTEDLKSHVLVHSGLRLSCSTCEYTCLQKRQLRKHELKHAQNTIEIVESAESVSKENQINCDGIMVHSQFIG